MRARPLFPAPADRRIAAWLLFCAAFVAAIVIVGGATRLTRSGLSIVEWQPITGIVPPLTTEDWQVLFDKYRATPEYKQVNKGMSLEAFKGIFWWEYIHRVLARLIGIVFLVPLLWFWWRRQLDRPLGLRLAGLFVLGGLQGAMGWFMVKSGLVDDPKVSHLRLAAHLGLALAILSAMIWIALGLLHPVREAFGSRTRRSTRVVANVLFWMVFVMALSGALVAGIRAGYAYNTFPLMNGHFIPPELFMLEPWWKNFFYNMATVQFDHRMLAYLIAIVTAWLWWRVRRDRHTLRARTTSHFLLLALILQLTLGIFTVLLRVPITLGIAHQAGAVLLLVAALMTAHAVREN